MSDWKIHSVLASALRLWTVVTLLRASYLFHATASTPPFWALLRPGLPWALSEASILPHYVLENVPAIGASSKPGTSG